MNARGLRFRIRVKRSLGYLAESSLAAWVSFAAMLAGAPVATNPGTVAPDSLVAALPPPLIRAYGVCLFIGGLLKLVGILLPAIRIEIAGGTLLGASLAVFALATFVAPGAPEKGTLFITLTVSAALLTRASILSRRIHLLREDSS